MSFSISWITFCHVTLDYSFHSMSLACFLPRAFVFFYWLGTSFHFVVTYLMLWDMFIDHDHLVFALYTYHGLSTLFLCWILDSIFDSTLIFSLRKGDRDVFTFTFFWEIHLDHLIIFFSLWSSSLKVESRICSYRWSIDLVIVCFSYLFHLGLSIRIL